MAKLKSELTWSFSRDRLFKECRRAYFYHYYASWGGWDKDAGDFSRKAYLLKNIRNIDAWIGDIVHQVIKWLLSNKVTGRNILEEEACLKVKQLLIQTWEQSREKKWALNIKRNLNLFEHYYQCEPSREELTVKLQKAKKSIETIYKSGLMDFFSSLPKENFLQIDELDSFNFEGVKVFAVPDFAVKNGGYRIYDWKTGKKFEGDNFQLSLYSIYAMNKWGAQPGEIEIIPAYLTDETADMAPIEPVPSEKIRVYMKESINEMMSILLDIPENQADIELCPKTNDCWRCKKCKFKEICT